MSKIEVIGPKTLLVRVLETIQRSALMQIDGDIQRRLEGEAERRLAPFVASDAARDERRHYEDLDRRVGRLLALLPSVPSRASYLTDESALRAVANHIDTRLVACEAQASRQRVLREELPRLQQSLSFLETVGSLAGEGEDTKGRDFIAVMLKDDTALARLTEAAARLPQFGELRTTQVADGSYIGLLTTEKDSANSLREALRNDRIPEVPLPPYLEGRPLAEKLVVLRQRVDTTSAEAARIEQRQRQFAAAWRGLYEQVHRCLQTRLAVLDAGTEAFATDRCFVVFGWTPKRAVAQLKAAIAERHGTGVVVEERPILSEDLQHVPVALANRGYFKPYELLVSLLPPPRYTSFDPTPFIAISFPFFFGVILGDIGYGLVVLLLATGVLGLGRASRMIQDVSRILITAAFWAILLGLVYGEFFGEAGAHALGITPLLDRRTAIVPMLYISVSLGAAHVVFGLVLGFLSARKARQPRESAFRFVSIVTMLAAVGAASTYIIPSPNWLRSGFFVIAGATVPLLALTGGLLAPLEFVRHLGNVISYTRLMAVGLASVLLAYVANDLAAAIESAWLGIAVGVLLHAFNLVLGVFAPTVHALRLHYVEFFSKFFEPGGKRYEPLRQVQ